MAKSFLAKSVAPMSWLLVACLAPAARGQGTVVQLPTWRSFRTTTTVVVPDRGGMVLGGVHRARSGRQRFGSPALPGGVAMGSSRDASGLHLSAFIHDHQEMDRQLLGAGSGHRPADHGQSGQRPAKRFAAENSDPAPLSVAKVRARQQAADRQRQVEADACLERGLDAAATGQPGVAKIYLQMAARRAAGELKQRVDLELKRLDTPVAAKIDR